LELRDVGIRKLSHCSCRSLFSTESKGGAHASLYLHGVRSCDAFGFFYALDARTGELRWKFQVDCQNSVIPVPAQCLGPGQNPPPRFFTDGGLITSSAAVVGGKVYFAAGKTLYSLDARDGTLRWKHIVCGNPQQVNCASDRNDPTRIFSSPAVFEDAIFVGWTVDGAVGYRGAFGAFERDTGRPLWRFEVDPIVDAHGHPVIVNGHMAGGQNRGCGNVWSSAAIDTEHHLVFFGTSDWHLRERD
jgi:outer membrane protein assembly factor BamB